jgi:stage III sporulation protein AF
MQEIWLWVKQIVLITCLAAIFDLVLPSSDMQRYAKFVMRLLLFLCLLQPMRSLLSIHFEPNAFLPNSWTHTSNVPALSTILEEGKQLQGEREQQSLQVTVDAIERQIATDVADTYHCPVRRVRVTLDTSSQASPQLAQIDVSVRASKHRRAVIAAWLHSRYGQAQTHIQVRDVNNELLPTTAPSI